MSASINGIPASMSAGAARTGTAGPLSGGGAGGVRPQVQSRRVSLKLGPLGITYSTDQVLWSPEAAEAAATAIDGAGRPDEAGQDLQAAAQASAEAASTAPVTPIDPVPPVEPQQYAGAAPGRSFHQDLAAAWRRETEARAAQPQAYGPDGRDGGDRSAYGTAATTVTTSAAGAAVAASDANATSRAAFAPAPEEASAPAADPAQPGQAASDQTSNVRASNVHASPGQASTIPAGAQPPPAGAASARNAEAPPAALMRRAIGAYLSCARQFAAAGSMLTAVA
ncbi:MAG: hypothetical protein HY916_03020 [Desulfovibrio sp.]|jgi:hypothetical protein|nr:hypothetical protein [Desulfovibrio sp.]